MNCSVKLDWDAAEAPPTFFVPAPPPFSSRMSAILLWPWNSCRACWMLAMTKRRAGQQ